MPTEAIEFLKPLMKFNSVSSRSNADISDHIDSTLQSLDFETERVEYVDANGELKVSVVGRKGPTELSPGGMGWFGHTDVVPADDWHSSDGPFVAIMAGDRLYGRGSCDMKGPIACMLAAAARTRHVKLNRPLFITCTSDEEVGYFGAAAVVRESNFFREMVARQTSAIIGEPTMLDVVYAHKGSVGFVATARGRAAHSSSREGINANLAMIPFLQVMHEIHEESLRDTRWQDDRFDPPTISWNIGINDHNSAVNITAAQSVCTVYFRPMPDMDSGELLNRAQAAAEQCDLKFKTRISGPAMYTAPDGEFIQEVLQLVGRKMAKTVCYGTDAAEFSELQNRVVCGPGDIAQAHTRDEWITLEQLASGTNLYEKMIRHWCSSS